MTKVKSILDHFQVSDAQIIEQIGPEPEETIFLSGSLVDGLGNNRSDLDIFLLFNANATGVLSYDRNYISSGRRFDVSYISESLLQKVICTLESLEPANPSYYFPRVLHESVPNYETITMLHRLRVGIPIYNAKRFSALCASIPWERYFIWNYRIKLNEFDGFSEDVMGAIESGDLISARSIVGLQLDLLLELLLSARRISYDRAKWVVKKVSLLSETDSLARRIFQGYQKYRYSSVASERLAEAQHLGMAMQWMEDSFLDLQMEINWAEQKKENIG